MKKILALTVALACVLALTACGVQKEEPTEEKAPASEQNVQTEQVPQLEQEPLAQALSLGEKNDFELQLIVDGGDVFTTEDEIRIWAMLEYVGKQEAVTIWHGDPYITFSIKDYMTDGDTFRVDGLILTILTSTELERGKVYSFDYVKSGGYSEDDPDADFWREFYQTKELKLPAGTYTVTVDGAFYLTEDLDPAGKGPSASLEITVIE